MTTPPLPTELSLTLRVEKTILVLSLHWDPLTGRKSIPNYTIGTSTSTVGSKIESSIHLPLSALSELYGKLSCLCSLVESLKEPL